jgi:hypothetical protein
MGRKLLGSPKTCSGLGLPKKEERICWSVAGYGERRRPCWGIQVEVGVRVL